MLGTVESALVWRVRKIVFRRRRNFVMDLRVIIIIERKVITRFISRVGEIGKRRSPRIVVIVVFLEIWILKFFRKVPVPSVEPVWFVSRIKRMRKIEESVMATVITVGVVFGH